MNVDLEKLTMEAACKAIAGSLIENINTTQRDQILAAAVAKALTEWDFRRTVEKEVAACGEAAARKLLLSEECTLRVEAKVQEGMRMFLESLPRAVCNMLVEATAGKSGSSYDNAPGLLLKHLNIELRERNP